MSFALLPAHEIPFSKQAAILNRAFHGYLAGWAEMDAAAVARFICAQGIDLCHSRFVSHQGEPAGFGYINRTGNISRLSAMGTVPEARRIGVARWLLAQLLEEAKNRRDEAMMLEVFEQNTSAVELYRQSGFQIRTRLFGWRRTSETAPPERRPESLEEIRPIKASQWPSAFEYPEIPWQISRHAVAKVPLARAFGRAGACIVVGDPAAPFIRLHGFLAKSEDWNAWRDLLSALLAFFPQREFFAPAIFPEPFGEEIFQSLGFAREPLNQFLMRRELNLSAGDEA